ncbi:MAG: hypothetical protein QOJ99_137, partial [Bryobacterales bacterium]|nr:hypothetical protein [Bryobacterales bacterium]
MKYLFRVFLLVLLLAGTAGGYVLYRLSQPYQGFSEPVFVEFPHGTSTGQMATVLAEKGVIQDRWLFL